jgi:hypothetical protein
MFDIEDFQVPQEESTPLTFSVGFQSETCDLPPEPNLLGDLKVFGFGAHGLVELPLAESHHLSFMNQWIRFFQDEGFQWQPKWRQKNTVGNRTTLRSFSDDIDFTLGVYYNFEHYKYESSSLKNKEFEGEISSIYRLPCPNYGDLSLGLGFGYGGYQSRQYSSAETRRFQGIYWSPSGRTVSWSVASRWSHHYKNSLIHISLNYKSQSLKGVVMQKDLSMKEAILTTKEINKLGLSLSYQIAT